MDIHTFSKQLTPFVGRESEINEINDTLVQAECRLLSLVGPGGIGKTRLALEIAHQNQKNFEDGVVFIALQPLVSAEGIVSTIAGALQFNFYDSDNSLLDQLLAYLSDKTLLLVMDDFTDVLDGAAVVTQILSAAPNIKILVTSREALKLQQEWMRPVSGMLYPNDINAENIESYSAVQLFIERAKQQRSHFSVNDEMPFIIRICQMVGGMPLGLNW